MREPRSGSDPARRCGPGRRGRVWRSGERWGTARAVVFLALAVAGLSAVPAVPAPAAAAPIDPSRVCASAPRTDLVDRGTTHALAIDCLTFHRDPAGAPVIRGLGDGTFGTDRSVTRAQFASLVHRFLTVADPGFADRSGRTRFPDVVGSAHAEAIAALGSLGVLDGRRDGSFGPAEPLSRGAAASALARALEAAGVGPPDRPVAGFDDQGDSHGRAITQLAELGVVAGVAPDRFAPFEEVTRGQLVTFLARSAELLERQDAWAADPVTGRPPVTARAATPRGTPAAVHPPQEITALGDSITQASGATRPGEGFLDVLPGGRQPARSWATGTALGIDSVLQRLRAGPSPGATGHNLAVNGARIADGLDQAAEVPVGTDLVVLQLGGNDLCRPSVERMTSPEEYGTHTREILDRLGRDHPAALIHVASVPDVYRLWEVLRHDPAALILWNGNGLLPPLVPCQSLLADARSDDPVDRARRAAVRDRSRAYNQELARACAERLRCRYDDGATWRLTNDPARFGVDEVSRADFFHPSVAGQRRLAEVAWDSGADHTNTAEPVVAVAVIGGEVLVRAEAGGEVAGIEHRHLRVREQRPDWTAASGPLTTIALDRSADALEVRAVDVDGNVSASRVLDLR